MNAQVAETPTLLGGTAMNTPDKVKTRNSPKVQPFENKSMIAEIKGNDVIGVTMSINNAVTTEENFQDDLTHNFDPPPEIMEMLSNIDPIGASGKGNVAPYTDT